MTATTTQTGRYQIMPEMSEEEYQQLKEDIKRNGVITPLEFDQNGVLIDGHHRFRAYCELIAEGFELPLFDKITRRFETDDARYEYVISLNLKRRHLNPEQRAELIVKLRKPPFGYTMSKIASIMSVSVATISRAIDALPDDLRAELKSLQIEGADGRVYSADYAPRITYATGYTQLREKAQRDAVKAGEAVRLAYPVPAQTPVRTILATPTATPVTPPVTPDEPEAPTPVQAEPETNMIAELIEKGRTPTDTTLSAMPYYGGKGSHLTWLLPLLPYTNHFIDLFGGSAAVLLNKQPTPIETYNDLDGAVVNFFKVLRDQPEELVRLLALTPFSRGERRHAYRTIDTAKYTDVEKARLYYVLARQTRNQVAQRTTNNKTNSWRFTRDAIRHGMPAYVLQWQNTLDALAYVAARLRSVQLESYPWQRLLELYANENTLVYADPPYVTETRARDKREIYMFEMTDQEHIDLSTALHKWPGLAAISGYRCQLYDDMYKDWHRFDMPTLSASAVNGTNNTSESRERIESLWTNYALRGPS